MSDYSQLPLNYPVLVARSETTGGIYDRIRRDIPGLSQSVVTERLRRAARNQEEYREHSATGVWIIKPLRADLLSR
jgi:DNA-binding HxlR family transcriptional regulator